MFYIFLLLLVITNGDNPLIDNHRPPPSQRRFNSTIIEKTLQDIVPKMIDQDLALIFVDCFPNTLDTTVFYNNNETGPDTFIITGDINAMWLRDSSGQVYPYVQFATQDTHLQNMLRGLIRRQMFNINIDSYANGFNMNASGSPWDSDKRHPPMTPYLWEGKYEIDSLAWVLKLSAYYFNVTKDDTICTTSWFNAITRIYNTIQYQQQQLDEMSPQDELFYSFARETNTQSETLQDGVGVPSLKCGLSRAGFRPSDDAQRLPFQIAGNAFASVGLAQVSKVLQTPGRCYNLQLSQQLLQLSNTIRAAIQTEGVVPHKRFNQVYAYEVDGLGSQLIMDDANVPSLLSLPYLEYITNDNPIYTSTRSLLYSDYNPYYFCGKAGCGIGSPHTGLGSIWPMSIIMRAYTSNNDNEIKDCLNFLKNSTAGTYFMHESFNKDNSSDYTRKWFAWANSMFGELIVKLAKERPYILFGNGSKIN